MRNTRSAHDAFDDGFVPVATVLMRLTALPVAIAVTVGLQIGFYVADLPLGAATLGAIMAGCAAYLLVRSRQAPEGER